MNRVPSPGATRPVRNEAGAEYLFTRIATSASFAAGQPLAFAIALTLIALWILTGPIFAWSDTWQLVVNTATTIVTFLMVFLIQDSQSRNAAALQAKLDEVIRSLRTARNEFIGIEHLTDSEIEAIRAALEREAENSGVGRKISPFIGCCDAARLRNMSPIRRIPYTTRAARCRNSQG